MTRFFVAVLVTALPALAWAEGVTCGPTCTMTWNAVTTYTDGVLIPADKPVTYGVFIATTNTKPATATAVTMGPSFIYTPGATGQRYVWVTARSGGQEGAPTTAVPFVVTGGVPATPSDAINVR
jgi:hypothetical protein